MIGAHRDPVFGPVVVVGDGGKYVEVFRDTKLLLPPFTVDDVKQALGRLRIAPLFAGVRGEQPMDVDALADAVVKIGELMARRLRRRGLDRPQPGAARQCRRGLRGGRRRGVLRGLMRAARS